MAASSCAAAAASCSSAKAQDEGQRQIPEHVLQRDPDGLTSMLGGWTSHVEELASRFAASGPVPHVLIDNFFAEPLARALSDEFPPAESPIWHVYHNPLEKKRACSDMQAIPDSLREAVCALCGPAVVEAVRRITGLETIDSLQADPFCHGGGLHSHGRDDKLDLHLDYSIHPMSGLERRFNLIVYLPKEAWREEYGGALELWSAGAAEPATPSTRVASVLPVFNRALLFSTTAPSFHGFPTPIACPEHVRRESIALYYLTPPRPGAPPRSKALYVAAPGDLPDTNLDRLRMLRSQRRLEPSDLEAQEQQDQNRLRAHVR